MEFSPIEEIIADIKAGKLVIIVETRTAKTKAI